MTDKGANKDNDNGKTKKIRRMVVRMMTKRMMMMKVVAKRMVRRRIRKSAKRMTILMKMMTRRRMMTMMMTTMTTGAMTTMMRIVMRMMETKNLLQETVTAVRKKPVHCRLIQKKKTWLLVVVPGPKLLAGQSFPWGSTQQPWHVCHWKQLQKPENKDILMQGASIVAIMFTRNVP